MSMSDEVFLDWIRGRSGKDVRLLVGYDYVGCARDVSMCQLWLYTLVVSIAARRIVEIGVADGSTTIPLLKGAEEMGGIVHSVDPCICTEANALVDAFGYRKIWTFHFETSDEFFTHYNDSIDLAFIDGDHRCSAVTKDIRNVLSRLSPGGFVLLHDWNPNSLDNIEKSAKDFPEDDTVCGVSRALASGVLEEFLPIYVFPVFPEQFNWNSGLPRKNGAEGKFLLLQKPAPVGPEVSYWKELGLWGVEKKGACEKCESL